MATAKCPVCDWEIKDQSVEVKAGDKKIVACCEDCAKQIQSNPVKFAKAK